MDANAAAERDIWRDPSAARERLRASATRCTCKPPRSPALPLTHHAGCPARIDPRASDAATCPDCGTQLVGEAGFRYCPKCDTESNAAEARYWETITLGTGNTSGVYDTRAEAIEAVEALEAKHGVKSAVVGFDAQGIAVERAR